MMLSSRAVDRVLGYRLATTANSSPLDCWTPAARGYGPRGFTTAKKMEVSVVSDTAGEKRNLARRSTGLDYSSCGSRRVRWTSFGHGRSDMVAAPSVIGRNWFPFSVSIDVSGSSGFLDVSVERW